MRTVYAIIQVVLFAVLVTAEKQCSSGACCNISKGIFKYGRVFLYPSALRFILTVLLRA